MRRSPRAIAAWFATAVVAFATFRVVAGDLNTLHRRAHDLGANVQVVLAAHDLPLGAAISRADVRVVVRPRAMVPDDTLHDAGAAIGRIVLVPFVRDDVVRDAHLTKSSRGGLDDVVAPGQRAVHLVLKDGFRPPLGAVVDVLASFDPASISSVGARGRAAVVASGARVLSVDEAPQSGAESTAGVTLLLTDTEAPAVAFAAATGEVALALAPPENACCTSSRP